jgi:hypothetical protein
MAKKKVGCLKFVEAAVKREGRKMFAVVARYVYNNNR